MGLHATKQRIGSGMDDAIARVHERFSSISLPPPTTLATSFALNSK